MIYICPTCGKEYPSEQEVCKHFLKCWKDNNPHHKSKAAPRSADIHIVKTNDDITQFFNSFKGGDSNERGVN